MKEMQGFPVDHEGGCLVRIGYHARLTLKYSSASAASEFPLGDFNESF